MTVEHWDGYFADGKLANQILTRGENIPSGLFHLVVEVIVQHTDGSFLFMKRDSEKPSYPNYYEITAGGSALSGETALEAIQRELMEETGIFSNSFILIDKYLTLEDACIFNIFYTKTNIVKNSISLQKEETIDYQWITPRDLNDFLNTKLVIPRQIKHLQHVIKKS